MPRSPALAHGTNNEACKVIPYTALILRGGTYIAHVKWCTDNCLRRAYKQSEADL